MTTRALCLTTILIAAGCSSPAEVALDDAPDQVGRAACQRLTECSVLGLALLSQTSCEVGAYSYRNDLLALLDAWVADGTVRYDGEAMAGCLDDLAAAACPDLSGLLTDVGRCGDALVGTVASGGACQGSLQCAAGLFCDTDLACPGVCAARGGAGAACPADAGCQPGLECDGGTCAALLMAGAPCDSSFACAPGFQCDLSGGSTGVCRALSFTAGAGEPCLPVTGELCQAPLVCAPLDTTGASWTCQDRAAVDEPCSTAVPSQCPVGSVCLTGSGQVTGTCTALPGEGQPCLTSSSLVLQCQEELTCESTSRLCVRRLDNGAACTLDIECANRCDGVCLDPDCTT